MKTTTFIDPATTEILANTAIVFVCFVALVAIGLRIMNAMMDDAEPTQPTEADRHIQGQQGNAQKPRPETEH